MSFNRNADVMVWDNGGKTADRFTVAIINKDKPGWSIFHMSEKPQHPQGVCMFGGSFWAFTPTVMWGKRVAIRTLPKEVQKQIKAYR